MSPGQMSMMIFPRRANINDRMMLCQLKKLFDMYSFYQELRLSGLNFFLGKLEKAAQNRDQQCLKDFEEITTSYLKSKNM